ncbi:MAG: DUF499 domain-containing protein [Acidobacteriota bacterium]|nr:DUF499 domain-containing protein [Acidobacteriota bacterium]
MERLAGTELRVTLWPQNSQDVPDSEDIKLVILALEHTRQATRTDAFVRELLEKSGQTFRTYRNVVLVLAADEGEFASARQNLKRLLALRAIREDRAIWPQLSDENRRMLESRLKDVEGGIVHRLMSAYRHLAKADEQGLKWLDLGLPTVGSTPSLARRVYEYLQTEDLLLGRISPRHVLEKAIGTVEPEKPVDEIYEAFLRYPQLPLLENKQVLLNAIAQGVKEKTFGVKVGERIYYGQEISTAELEAGATVVREPEAATQMVTESKKEGAIEEPSKALVRGAAETSSTPTSTIATAGIRGYRLVAVIPWDKLSDFVRGVVTPLRHDGADITLQITLEARSEKGIQQTTLDQKVRETLQQIGAKVIKEEV